MRLRGDYCSISPSKRILGFELEAMVVSGLRRVRYIRRRGEVLNIGHCERHDIDVSSSGD